MKWTTANFKNSNYNENHEIYVGTHTGSFKKLVPGYEDNPFAQKNLYELSKLDKASSIRTLAYGAEDKSEILIGRNRNRVEIHSLYDDQIVRSIDVHAAPVVGLAKVGDDKLVAGFENGQIQLIDLSKAIDADKGTIIIKAGDNIAHLRQCSVQRNLIATGGKERQNNLKIFDMLADGKQLFASKNLPNDYLQLEVPVWDSDVDFIDSPHILATCSRHGYVRVYDTRKQRRPVQSFATENQMSFTTLATTGNFIYTGTTMGALKAFDIRRMKTFIHTYKGFTGGISDLNLDDTGKYLVSACLDRYARVHHVDSCVLLYQCYVKSKATQVLLRKSHDKTDIENYVNAKDALGIQTKTKSAEQKSSDNFSEDEEYETMFKNMQTIRENDDGTVDENKIEHSKTIDENERKRKNVEQSAKNKKKKN